MSWKTIFMLQFILIYAEVEQREEIMMVVSAGSGINVLSLWNSSSVVNDIPGDEKHLWNVSTISQQGSFRSEHANHWNSTNFPVKAILSLHNQHGDILWQMQFNTSQCNYTSSCWMKPERILNSTSDITTTMIGQNENEFLMSPTLSHSSVWMVIWNATEYHPQHPYPMFVFSANVTKAYPLLKEDFGDNENFSFVGCFQNLDLHNVYEGSSASMTTALCYSYCSSRIHSHFHLRTGTLCYCGHIINHNRENDAFCDVSCAGDPHSSHCGTSTIYGVYEMSSGGSISLKSTFSGQLGSKELVIIPKIGTTSLMVDVLEYLGDAVNPGFINGIMVNIVNMSMSYSVEYSLNKCAFNITGRVLNPNNLFTTSSVYRDTGLLALRCLWLVFNTAFTDSNTNVHVSLFYQNETKFYSGSLLAISVVNEYDVTTNTATSTSTVTQELTTEAIDTTLALNTTTISTVEHSTTNNPASIDQTTTITATSTPDVALSTSGDTQIVSTVDPQSDSTSNILTTSATPTTTNSPETTSTTVPTTAYPSNAHTTSTGAIVQSTTSDDTVNEQSTATTQTVDTTTTQSTSGAVSGTPDNNTCLCSCVSGHIYNVTEDQLKTMITELRRKLLLNKTGLSSYIRTKMSAKDNRISAQGIGYSGAILLVLVISFPVVMDMTKFVQVSQKNGKSTSDKSKESKNV